MVVLKMVTDDIKITLTMVFIDMTVVMVLVILTIILIAMHRDED